MIFLNYFQLGKNHKTIGTLSIVEQEWYWYHERTLLALDFLEAVTAPARVCGFYQSILWGNCPISSAKLFHTTNTFSTKITVLETLDLLAKISTIWKKFQETTITAFGYSYDTSQFPINIIKVQILRIIIVESFLTNTRFINRIEKKVLHSTYQTFIIKPQSAFRDNIRLFSSYKKQVWIQDKNGWITNIANIKQRRE